LGEKEVAIGGGEGEMIEGERQERIGAEAARVFTVGACFYTGTVKMNERSW
jgi:hypothetical protein